MMEADRLGRGEGLRTVGISALVGGIASYCICGVIPFQTYVAVSECFRYSAWDLLASYGCEAILTSVVLTVVLSAVALLGRGRLRERRYAVHVVVIGLVLAILLETGVLSIGLPQLNGDIGLYGDKTRRVVDSVVWIGLLAVCIVFAKPLSRHLVACCMAVFLFASSSLLDVRRQQGLNVVAEDAPAVGGMKILPRWNVVRSGCYSPTNNVLFLIVDSVTREVVSDIFRSDAGLADEFAGFTAYEDNLGMHWASDVATAGLTTGLYLESPLDVVSYVRQQFTTNSFAADYDRRGFPVFVNVAVSGLGLTNHEQAFAQGGADGGIAARRVRMEDMFPWSVEEIARFRMVPYALKRKYLKHLVLVWQLSSRPSDVIHSDRTLWPYLAQLPIDSSIGMTLHIDHSPGGHPPLHFDETGNWSRFIAPTYENYRRQCVYVFRQLADLMRTYRARGLYDVSTIVIMADHGGIRSADSRSRTPLPDMAIPALMVKPRGERGPLRMNSLPTSHSRLRALSKALCDRDLSVGETDAILTQTHRLYRALSKNGFRDWIVGPGNAVTCRDRTVTDNRLLEPLVFGKQYGFETLGVGSVCDYRGTLHVGVRSSGHVRFRLPGANRRFVRVELELLVGQGTEASTAGSAEVEIAGQRRLLENVFPLQLVRLIWDCSIDGEWLDVGIDTSKALFALSLRSLRVSLSEGE